MHNRTYLFKLESGQPIVECVKAANATHAREKLVSAHAGAYAFDEVSDLPLSEVERMYDEKVEFYQFIKKM